MNESIDILKRKIEDNRGLILDYGLYCSDALDQYYSYRAKIEKLRNGNLDMEIAIDKLTANEVPLIKQ